MHLVASAPVWLALTLQGVPAPRLPIAVYPVLGHGADSLAGASLTRALDAAFGRDSALVLVPARRARGSRAPAPRYGVVSELHGARDGSLTLSVRIVDVPGVYLVARDSVSGTRAEIQRALPALARRVSGRLTTLQWPVFTAGPPPSWLVPTDALRFYARALDFVDRGDTAAARGSLRRALSLFPSYREACDALRRFGEDPPCHP